MITNRGTKPLFRIKQEKLKMKKTLLFSVAMATAIGFAQAEPNQQCAPKGPKGGNRLEEMSAKLNLTADQKAKLQPIMESNRQAMKAIHEDTTSTEEQKRAKAQQQRESFKAQLSSILTPEQMQQLDSVKPKRGPGGRKGHGGGHGHGEGAPQGE